MSDFFARKPCAVCPAPRRTLPTNSPLAEGWGSDGDEDPHGEATRRVGPVTGTAGSEEPFGGSGVTSPAKAEGLLMLIPSGAPHLIMGPPDFRHHAGHDPCPLATPARDDRVNSAVSVGQTGHVHCRPVGHHALLVEVDDAGAARSLAAWAREQEIAADEIVPAAETVLLDGVADPGAVREALTSWEPSVASGELELVEIPVTYDGEDLAFVADRWGIERGGRGRGARRGRVRRRPSAGSRPASPTSRDCPRNARYRGWTRLGRRCRPARSGWPGPGRRSIRPPRPAAGG